VALGLRAGLMTLSFYRRPAPEQVTFTMWLTSWLRDRNRATNVGSAGRAQLRLSRRRIAARCRPQLEALECRNLLSTLTVLNSLDSGPGSLRAAIVAANSGDKIVFDPGLGGQTITLTSGELVINQGLIIQGPGTDQLTVSGNGDSRVFNLTGRAANVTIAGLTIANGLAAQGGGIENAASNLTLSDDVLSNDQAVGGPGEDAEGGGIFNGGAASLLVRDSVFVNDVARGIDRLDGGRAGNGFGGGLFNQGMATLKGTSFSANEAIGGGSTGAGGNGFGGGIMNDTMGGVGGMLTVLGSNFLGNQGFGGWHGTLANPIVKVESAGNGAAILNQATLVVRDSTFIGNQVHGGAGLSGVAGGNGGAGAIKSGSEDTDPPASASLSDCTFLDNRSTGGTGGDHAAGAQGSCGAFLADHGVDVLRGCTFIGNESIGGAGGIGANGGPGRAGALRLGPRDGNVSVLATDCFFAGNKAIGGTAGLGGVGGLGEGGAVANVQIFGSIPIIGAQTSNLTLRDCVLTDNEAVGGAGATGGVGRGGGISNAGGLMLINPGAISTAVIDCVVSDNVAQGGDGSAGNGGNGLGGGIFTDKTAVLSVTGSTITDNAAIGAAGFSDGKGQGGGVFIATGAKVCIDLATTITGNHASTSDDDVFGVFTTC
jgi:hypothetical protein